VKKQLKVLMIVAGALLVTISIFASLLGREVLNPLRTVTLSATGDSILAFPRPFFKTPALVGSIGQPLAVPVYIDSNGGNLTSVSAQIRYNPLDMSIALGETARSVCNAYTRKDHDEISGSFSVTCNAPSSVNNQISPFLTFIVTPKHTGGLPIELVGRTNDYGVITAQ
jgi:hypothetical protein